MPTAVKVPYEFLVRWSEGVISGAHVGWSLLVTEDDGTKRELPQPVEPVDIGQGKGFPLADILQQAHIDALGVFSAQDSKIKDLEKKVRARKDAADARLVAQIEAKNAELAAKATEHAAEKAAKDAEIEVLKMPEKERKAAELRVQAEKALAEAEALDPKTPKKPK